MTFGQWTSNDNTTPPPPLPPSGGLDRRSAKFDGSPGISKVKEPMERVVHPSHTTDIDTLLLKKSAVVSSMAEEEKELRGVNTSQVNQPDQAIHEVIIRPGAQAIAGMGESSSSTAGVSTSTFPSIVSEKTHSEPDLPKVESENQLQTAVLIDEEQQELDEAEKYKIISQAKSDAEAKLKATAVQAEDAEDLEREVFVSRKRKQIGIAILLVVMLTAGIVVGVVLGTRGPDPDPTAAPSEAPSPAPTPVREIFIPPTFNNTLDDDQAPDIVPDDGASSEFDPMPPQVLNNACRDAFDLATVVGTPIVGSNERATVDRVDTCEAITRNGRGVWYRLQGDGSRYVASTCDATDFNTQISIYSGVCGRLQCLAGNDRFSACGDFGDQSKVAWYTEPGTDYLIYVHGRREGSAGFFQLTVDSLDDNDECENAQSIESGRRYFGTTRGASIDIIDGCTDEATPGVWFTFIGDGEDNQVIEFYGGSGSSFVGRAFIFRGSDCASIECLGRGRFDAIEGEVFYILVQGTGIVEGDFEIRIEDDSAAGGSRENSFPCEDPFTIPAGLSVDSVADGNTNVGFGSCGNLVFNTGHGGWFTTTGTGRALTASTCGGFEGFDTQISVFLGSCDNLVCIDGNDQACGDQSSVSWFTEDGVQYLILVHGYGDASGSFTLSVEESNVTSSDECQSAIPIIPDGISNLGTTDGASFDDVPICEGLGSTGVGVWYEVRGTGQRLSASTCDITPNQAAKVAVFQGDCNVLECVEGTYTPCGSKGSFTWTTVFDERYYIFIQDPGVEQRMAPIGSFILTLEEEESNDLCENYIGPLLPGGSPMFGSTRSATIGDMDACVVTKAPSRDVFYTVVGTGEELAASVCSVFTNFDAHIQVFENGCDDLQCIEVVNGGVNCNQGTLVRWPSVAEELYSILISGTDAKEYGNFALTVSSRNDLCVGAYGPLPTNTSTTIGSTINATVDEFFCRGRVTYPGVWYYVVGTGSRMTATTCDSNSNFETRIAIFSGTCVNLECLRGTGSNPCGLQSAESWNSIEGELYYILVHGSGVGDFGLSVALENYICPSAERIPTGEFTSSFLFAGSTTEAAIADASVLCGIDVQSLGAWYVLQGNGRNILASTCNIGTSTFATRLSIFRGNCGDLECIASNDNADFCDDRSEITFTTSLGEEYYILIHGANSTSSGDFVLYVEEQQHQECDFAGGPFDLLESSVLVAGSVPPVRTALVEGGGVACGSSVNFGEGFWIRMEGTGGPIVASTCNDFTYFDTELSVYTGTCHDLQCVDGNDNVPSVVSRGPDGCFYSGTSEVSWSSRQGVAYWILVHGHLEVFGDGSSNVTFGDFRLSIENGNCPIAEVLNMDGSLNVGSTVGKVNANASPCTLEESPGIWYVVEGRGSNIIASSCHEGTVLDTRISVFRGNICEGNLECVETNDDADGCGAQSTVEFMALWRVEYFILVQGAEALSTGDFLLSVEESRHQVCPNAAGPMPALEIVIDGTLPPSEAVEEVGDQCGSAPNFGGGGYWYYVIGTGRPITASTCHFSTDFDTVLIVYTGTCSLLECVVGNDDACAFQSEVSWLSREGVGYFIQLQGFEDSFGNFRLTIDCLRAKGILIDGPNEFGSLDERPNFDVTFCGIDVQSPGALYVVTGRGSNIKASTCNEGTTFDTRISIFRGDLCSGDVKCVATNDNIEECGELSTVIFPADWGEEYYILVQSAGEFSRGDDFVLSVEEIPPERCALANGPMEVVVSGLVFAGTILPGVPVSDQLLDENVDECGSATDFFNGTGFWVSILGTGGSVIVSTCNAFTDFDTQLTVYTGTCDALECVQGIDDVASEDISSGLAPRTCSSFGRSEVAFSSRQDVVYYIFVHGDRSSFGEFRLSIGSGDCPVAKRLQPSSKAKGSTIGRKNADASACGFAVSSPGAWHVIEEGSGRDITASTCSKNTDFQARISVFQGDLCEGGLECVPTNSATDGCDNGGTVSFSTTFGEQYFILVHGVDALSAGSFLLSLDENHHDTCATAAGPVDLDGSYLVLVEGTIPDSDFVETRGVQCGLAVNFGETGYFHSVIGTGGTIVASTCNFYTRFDTQLSVYTGTCSSLECVAGNNDVPSVDSNDSKSGCSWSRSEVSWSSREDVVYFIFVHGSEGSFGDFRLSIETRRCPLAEQLSVPRSVVQGSTIGKADTYAYGCDVDVVSAGTWYVIVGRGSNITTSTCNEGTDFDTRISVFQGDICYSFSLECVTTNDDASECGTMSTVNFATRRWERYYILVHGGKDSSDAGNFVLSIQESRHESCAIAAGPVSVEDNGVAVVTSISPMELLGGNKNLCENGTHFDGFGFWHSVIGTGGPLVASTCFRSGSYAKVYVATGSCDQLECVPGGEYCDGSEVVWASRKGTIYFVFLQNVERTSRDVELWLGQAECPVAKELSVQNTKELDSTIGRVSIDASACDIFAQSPGVWYVMEGRGSDITASTCDEGTTFDTRISVFQGNLCDFEDLECVATSDNAAGCGEQSRVTYSTLMGVQYFILVHGASALSIGDFVLSIEESLHDSCEDALGARNIPFSVRTSLGADGGLIDNAIPSCGSASNMVGRAFWLSVIGRNDSILASTCSSFSDFDTQLSIFTGACGNLSCVAGNDDVSNANRGCGTTSEVWWFGEEAVTYHVLVHGFQGDSGSFSLTIDT